jgi:hypothetical protein
MVEPRVTWRVNPIGRTVCGLMAVFFIGIPTAGVVAWLSEGHAGIGLLLALIECPLVAVGLWRGGVRASLTLTEQELLIKNPIRTYRVPLIDVTSATPGYSGIVITTSSDENVCAWAVQKSNIADWSGWRTRADDVAAVISEAARVARTLGRVDLDEAMIRAAVRPGNVTDADVLTIDMRPVALVPSRVPLGWQMAVLAGLVAACVVTALVGGSDHAGAVISCGILALLCAVAISRRIAGRTLMDTRAVTNRGTRSATVLWANVEQVTVTRGLAGRRIRLDPVLGRRLTLAAPRRGPLERNSDFDETVAALQRTAIPVVARSVHGRGALRTGAITAAIVGLVALDQPWLDAWWPTRHEAVRVPAACSIASSATARFLVPNATQAFTVRRLWSATDYDCTETGPDQADVEVDVLVCRRAGSQSGTGHAQSGLEAWRGKDVTVTRIRGFGDVAYRSSSHDVITSDSLAVRKANVDITVTYIGPRPFATAVAADNELTRDALRQIRLS